VAAGEIGDPDQEQRGLADVLLPASEIGQPAAAHGVAHRHHAPELQI
jgi:hypothetical protein